MRAWWQALGRAILWLRSFLAAHGRVIIAVSALLIIAPVIPILIFRFVAPPITPLMVVRSIEGYHVEHHWVSFNAISLPVRRAAIYSEDKHFCNEASGIDLTALRYEISVWSQRRHPKGASTISMQTTRNLFLWPGHSYLRKVLELWITPELALLWPKDRVLEVYLNIVEFGPGIFGVQEAAQHYFGKKASQLDAIEAATLIAVLPDPLHRTPTTLPPDVEQRTELATVQVFIGDDPWFDCVTH